MKSEEKGYLWLIDAGHGGIDRFGVYQTKDEKMFDHGDFKIYEGLTNREIANILMRLMDSEGMNYRQIHKNIVDLSLGVRTNTANAYHEKYGNCIYLSIHSNRMPPQHAGKAKGVEMFVYKSPKVKQVNPSSSAYKVAQIFFDEYKNTGLWRMRKNTLDHDIKGANFHVLRETACPAVLLENLFFDRRNEAEYLMSTKGQIELAEAMFKAMQKVEELKLI